jgi:phosphoglycolate phosphatase
MSQYQVVVFDWDGTLMDSTRDIVRSMQLACADLDLPVPSDQQAAWVIGLSLERALEHVVPDLDEANRARFLERYRFHYLTRDRELRLFDGVRPMLDALTRKGVHLAVATGKSRVGLNRALETADIGHYFEATRCADETLGKPHPQMLFELMDEMAAEPNAVLMIGDTSHDLNMAANAGVHGLAVTYGAHDEAQLREHPHQDMLHCVASMHRWLEARTRSRF